MNEQDTRVAPLKACAEGLDLPRRENEPSPSPAPEKAKYRIWVAHCPFKKNGFPSLGTFGASEAPVVIFRMDTWKRLCADVPQLQTTQFEVGSQE